MGLTASHQNLITAHHTQAWRNKEVQSDSKGPKVPWTCVALLEILYPFTLFTQVNSRKDHLPSKQRPTMIRKRFLLIKNKKLKSYMTHTSMHSLMRSRRKIMQPKSKRIILKMFLMTWLTRRKSILEQWMSLRRQRRRRSQSQSQLCQTSTKEMSKYHFL